MADDPTYTAAPTFDYTPPPDFAGRRATIANAYTTALNNTQLARQNLYTQAGFVQGTSNLDQNNQFGDIQQMLHNEGQALTADDAAEEHRGLGLDSGLGAQAASGIRSSEAEQAAGYGNQFQQALTGYANDDTNALNTKNLGNTSVDTDSASYDAQNSAYNIALAAYLKAQNPQVASSDAPSNPGPANLGNVNGRASTGTSYYAPVPPKVGKVTISRGRVIGGT